MKITIFSFDLWGFNQKIAQELEKLGHDVNYVNSWTFKYKYPTVWLRILNFFTKFFLQRNLKKEIINKKIKEALTNNKVNSDIIFMVNPGYFSNDFSEEARKFTKKLIAYNYDSLTRVPLPKNYKELFDEIYCFDDEDIINNNFKHATNFNYISNIPLKTNHKSKYLAFAIQSVDKERMSILSKIADALDSQNQHNYLFLIKDKPSKKVNKNIVFFSENKSLNEVENLTKDSFILIDIVRENQRGLSFRFFEAMAYQKKIITTNKNILNYDFYNPQNILIINESDIKIPEEFLKTPYIPLSEDLFEKYTLQSWVKNIFKI